MAIGRSGCAKLTPVSNLEDVASNPSVSCDFFYLALLVLEFSRKCFSCLGNSFPFFISIQFCASYKYLDCMQLLLPICQP